MELRPSGARRPGSLPSLPTPRSWPGRSVASSLASTSSGSWPKPTRLKGSPVALAPCSGGRACTPLTCRRGGKRAAGILHALTPQKRGPKSKRTPLDEENQKLRRENQHLSEELRKAEIVIDIQKKVAPVVDMNHDPVRHSLCNF